MSYQETIDFLFSSVACFQQQGGVAYKPGLERVLAMAEVIGNPHLALRSIHVGGTNGKGSTASTLAAILVASGYKTGLFTSPHLVDFRERIRINGIPVSKDFVVDFVNKARPLLEKYSPSFFEITTLMAFSFFAEQKVDVAIIEVGMGGRLDSTNIIHPELSIITNVSKDHTQFLGTTLPEIAFEKAGIIKKRTPVVIGEAEGEVQTIFENNAKEKSAPIYFAEKAQVLLFCKDKPDGLLLKSRDYGSFHAQLGGAAQHLNARTILTALSVIKEREILSIPEAAVHEGFATVIEKSGLLGRWQQLSSTPQIFCDTGHNEAGVALVVQQIARQKYNHLHIVFGMVTDKDWQKVLSLLPKEAFYYFVAPPSERGLPNDTLTDYAQRIGLKGCSYPTIAEGFLAAKGNAQPSDLIYIGGSNYVVAEVLQNFFSQILQTNL